jgi:hypothetical protein
MHRIAMRTAVAAGKHFTANQDLIRNELNEAAETLANFLQDEANIHAIQRAAVPVSSSAKCIASQ